jgi:hypothetical protein
MALFSVLPKRGFVNAVDSGKSGYAGAHEPVALVFDAIVSETPEYSATPTQSLVEDGSTISDHVSQKPLRLTVQGIITDTPVGFGRQYANAFGGPNPSAKAFAYIERLFLARTPFDFVGGFRVYKSMVISRWTPTRDAQTGDSLRFGCVMEQVIITQSVKLLQIKAASKKAQPKVSQGGQVLAPKTVIDATGEDLTAHAAFTAIWK